MAEFFVSPIIRIVPEGVSVEDVLRGLGYDVLMNDLYADLEHAGLADEYDKSPSSAIGKLEVSEHVGGYMLAAICDEEDGPIAVYLRLSNEPVSKIVKLLERAYLLFALCEVAPSELMEKEKVEVELENWILALGGELPSQG